MIMNIDIIELAKACPDAIISVKVSDLIEANEALVARTKEQLEQIITDQSVETYPSREKVAELLDVDLSTLWRWAKRGLLVPCIHLTKSIIPMSSAPPARNTL